MKKVLLSALIALLGLPSLVSQNTFNYSLQLTPVTVPILPGHHSYAFGQANGKWVVIGGRRDGVHARQPFNAFPQNQNNDSIYVIDIASTQYWAASLNTLPSGIKEQLQSTNMNFYQEEDSLYIIGGYAYSPTANNHITFPKLTSIHLSGLINAIVNQQSISSYFKQITDNRFAICGGYMGKIGNTFYLVGGQKFDGRYNPMGNATYTQTYSNQIRKFEINNSGSSIVISNYTAITDAVHLHRRDYNLIPQIFPDGTEGYTISSGVFQTNANLPYLYPVDITANGYFPITGFNQYLSNYHSANASFYDSTNNAMHSIFFGGMSQYYYQNGTLIQDNQVPFVKTISRMSRFSDSSLQEVQLPIQMPNFQGAGAEFIPNHQIPYTKSEIVKLDHLNGDTNLIGHIYGGIRSNSLNPFAANQTNLTSADPTIYEVWLIRQQSTGLMEIDGKNPYELEVYPNPLKDFITLNFNLKSPKIASYMVSNEVGQIVMDGEIHGAAGKNTKELDLSSMASGNYVITLVIDHTFFNSKKVVKK